MKDSSAERILPEIADPALLPELRTLIAETRRSVARDVNSALIQLYWQIGRRVHVGILAQGRAEYGQQIVAALGRQLEHEFGRGFGEKNLHRMVQLAQVLPDEEMVAALRHQLGCTHFRTLLPIEEDLKRSFYAEMCRVEGWSTRMLQAKINGMMYKRTGLSKKPALLIEQELAALRTEDRLTPDLVFKDPYVLDFLGLRDTYSEKDLESALLREIERFLLELGAGFAFVERQKRIVVDGEDFYLDLLFFHLPLAPAAPCRTQTGQLSSRRLWPDAALSALARPARATSGGGSAHGAHSLSNKSEERIELLELEKTGIRVAQYLTELPPREVLESRLHEAMVAARARLKGHPSLAPGAQDTKGEDQA